MARLAAELAERAGLDARRATEIGLAVTLRDVGKLRVPDRLLRKRSALAGAEFALMREHTLVGAEILGDSEGFAVARQVARSHHENWDGTGYPDGLGGEQIPIEARIARVVDDWAALRARRSTRQVGDAEALRELSRGAGTLYDPSVVPALAALLSSAAMLSSAADGPSAVPTTQIPATPRGSSPSRRR